jgi:hypothetical protein
MYKVLVISCGNIGAQYDMHNNEVKSHVKAWHLNLLTEVFIEHFKGEAISGWGCTLWKYFTLKIFRKLGYTKSLDLSTGIVNFETNLARCAK